MWYNTSLLGGAGLASHNLLSAEGLSDGQLAQVEAICAAWSNQPRITLILFQVLYVDLELLYSTCWGFDRR
jgi:hypothetical protein